MKHTVLIALLVIITFSFEFPAPPGINSKSVRKTVSVPLIALERNGEAIRDLNPANLEVKLNGVTLKEFNFKDYNDQNDATKATFFLIFDTALAGTRSTEQSRVIAKHIIETAKPGTRIVLLSIDGFKGLGYLGEAVDKPKQLSTLLDTRIKNDADYVRTRVVQNNSDLTDTFREYETTLYRRKCSGLAKAFESLYFFFQTIDPGMDRRIFLFSEGISRKRGTSPSRGTTAGSLEFYAHYTRKTAGYLSHCGAVVTVINPMDPLDSGSDQYESTSGDSTVFPNSAVQSLLFITRAANGIYIEGSPLKIIERLKEMADGTYTLTLFVPLKFQGPFQENNSFRLSITPKNTEIALYAPNSIERIKPFSLRSREEQRFLALNLVTGHSLFQSGRKIHNVQVQKKTKKKEHVSVRFTIPEKLKDRRLYLIRLWVDENNRFITMNKEGVRYIFTEVKIKSRLFEGKEPYFVLFDPELPETAVYGNSQLAETSPAYVMPVSAFHLPLPDHIGKALMAINDSGPIIKNNPLEAPVTTPPNADFAAADPKIGEKNLKRLLDGAAGYCRQMKKSALHFVCDERIKLNFKRKKLKIKYGSKYGQTKGRRGDKSGKNIIDRTYLCQYQLISYKGKIKERRLLFKPDGVTLTSESLSKKHVPFLSERVFFGPIALLSRSHQPDFKYRFLGYRYDKKKRRNLAVIEAFPLSATAAAKTDTDTYSPYSHTIYGKIWIDTSDFSVVKILANPRSILSEREIQQLEAEFRGTLNLWVEAEFDNRHRELRFPSKVTILEHYLFQPVKYFWWKGKYQARKSKPQPSNYWTRSLTTYNYKDYRFFTVDTDVSYR